MTSLEHSFHNSGQSEQEMTERTFVDNGLKGFQNVFQGTTIRTAKAFDGDQCRAIESEVEKMVLKGIRGHYSTKSVFYSSVVIRHYFGENYVHRNLHSKKKDKRKKPQIYPEGEIEPIPSWFHELVEKPLVEAGIISPGFVNSVVVNVYLPIEQAVSHIESMDDFEGLVFKVSLLCDAALSIQGYFSNVACTSNYTAFNKISIERGTVFTIENSPANGISYVVHPESHQYTRAVIILRRVPRKVRRCKTASSSKKCEDEYPLQTTKPKESSNEVVDLTIDPEITDVDNNNVNSANDSISPEPAAETSSMNLSQSLALFYGPENAEASSEVSALPSLKLSKEVLALTPSSLGISGLDDSQPYKSKHEREKRLRMKLRARLRMQRELYNRRRLERQSRILASLCHSDDNEDETPSSEQQSS